MALAAQRTDDVVRIDKFDGKNFHLWKFKMQMVLEDRDLWTIVSGEEEEPSGQGVTQAAQEKFRKRSRKALAAICLSLCDSHLLLVRSSTTAREAWLKLEGHYETKSLANKLFLRKRYLTTMMSDSDTMIDHINKLRSLAKQLDSVGAPESAEDQVATLLCSLPDSYGNLIVALESRADDLTLEFVIARLLHEEKKRSETSVYLGDAMEKALVASKANPSSQAQKPSKKGKCFNCGIKGHWAKDCKRPKKKKEQHTERAHIATAGSHSVFWTAPNSNGKERSIWYVDSGASQHMSCQKDCMQNYTDFPIPEKVYLGDNRTVEAHGKGTVWLKVKSVDGYKPAELSDVLYVPNLAKNLFSVSAVTKKGLTMVFDDGKCAILDSNGTIMGSGNTDGKLFMLDSSLMKGSLHEAHSAIDGNSLQLWHERYGHLGVNSLKLLSNQKLVDGLELNPSEEIKFCEGCVKGKQTRSSFPKNEASRATELLEIIHSDVCGPMKTESLGRNRYFVTFIDDKSRYTAIYFMRHKNQVLEKFKEFEAMATNVSGRSIKVLRSDNGGEYLSKEFNDFLSSKGIKRQLTVPRTPEQNGVAERKNRTIQETARSMLHAAGLPDSFWAEAVLTAVILRNRSPTVAVKGSTPYESFIGKKPDVSNLKVFGCDAFMHVPQETRKKWDAKSVKCIFIGYSQIRKGYRLWNPQTKRVHETRDVVFVENDFGDRILKSEVKKIDSSTSTEDLKTAEIIVDDADDTDDEEIVADIPENNADPDEENIQDVELPRRSTRLRKEPDRGTAITGEWWNGEDSLNAELEELSAEPRNAQEALNSPARRQWQEALDSEYSSLMKNDAWSLVKLPKDRSAVGCRWVFKVKYNADGSVERHKARLVAKGYSQEEGVDYEETYSPVARYTSIRTVLAIANYLDLELHQMDVQTAFLNAELQEEIYMVQPDGYVEQGKEDLVCKLNKSLYGLKQSSRCWFKTMDSFLKESGYEQCKSDSCLYVRRVGDDMVIIALYVDDILIASNNKMLRKEKVALKERFNMKDMGEAHYCLGIQILRDS